MDKGTWHGLYTLLLMIVMVGVFLWAWSGKRKKGFDEAARLPLEDDDQPSAKADKKESSNG